MPKRPRRHPRRNRTTRTEPAKAEFEKTRRSRGTRPRTRRRAARGTRRRKGIRRGRGGLRTSVLARAVAGHRLDLDAARLEIPDALVEVLGGALELERHLADRLGDARLADV